MELKYKQLLNVKSQLIKYVLRGGGGRDTREEFLPVVLTLLEPHQALTPMRGVSSDLAYSSGESQGLVSMAESLSRETRSVCLQGSCFISLAHLTVPLPWHAHASRAALPSEVVCRWDADPQ